MKRSISDAYTYPNALPFILESIYLNICSLSVPLIETARLLTADMKSFNVNFPLTPNVLKCSNTVLLAIKLPIIISLIFLSSWYG